MLDAIQCVWYVHKYGHTATMCVAMVYTSDSDYLLKLNDGVIIIINFFFIIFGVFRLRLVTEDVYNINRNRTMFM